jgi:hypothetical protein
MIKDPNSLAAKAMAVAMYPFTKSPEQGAETSIYLASSPEVGLLLLPAAAAAILLLVCRQGGRQAEVT